MLKAAGRALEQIDLACMYPEVFEVYRVAARRG